MGNKRKLRQMFYKGSRGPEALGLFVGELPEAIAWYTGRNLTSVNLKKKDAGWLLILTAKTKKQTEVVFIDSPTPLGCYRNLWVLLSSSGVRWRPSKF